MKKKLSRRAKIILMFDDQKVTFSCQEVTNKIVKEEKLTDKYKIRYLPGSISSILAKLVKKGTLKYAGWTTARGGHNYQLNKQS